MLEASSKTKFKVGLFTVASLLILGYLSIYVNNHPFWWRSCENVDVTVEDATGLKTKSPVKTLGLDIGYVNDVNLVTGGVKIQICVTAPVVITNETRAHVRSEGFLGDKFLELKPVQYPKAESPQPAQSPVLVPAIPASPASSQVLPIFLKPWVWVQAFWNTNSALAQTKEGDKKQIPVAAKSADIQQVVDQMNSLVSEVKQVTTSLKDSIDPEEIRGTIKQLNKTLENAGKMIAPEGSLSSSAQRSLLKLEDAIDQMRDQITRINQGQGSVGKLLNDPVYADELQKALVNLNRFLNRANAMRLVVNIGLYQLSAYNASRAVFQIHIWTRPDAYYLIGTTSDPRGNITQTTTITEVAGQSTTVQSTQIERGAFSVTAMVGKVFFERYDVSMGLLHGDGAISLKLNLGPQGKRDSLQLQNDLYFRARSNGGVWAVEPNFRSTLLFQPFSIFYVAGGIEGVRKVNGQISAQVGGGIHFDDDDIKLLFSFL